MFDFHILTYAWCNSTSRLFNAGSEGQKRAIDLFLSCMPRAREYGGESGVDFYREGSEMKEEEHLSVEMGQGE